MEDLFVFLQSLHSLAIKIKFKVSSIKIMYTDITIFTSTAIALSIWMECNTINRSKVAFHTAKFFLKY